MRYLTLLLLLTSCQTWGWSETADALMPDEFTLGQGSSTGALTGQLEDGYGWHDFDFDSSSESESTYAALTWDIPSVKNDAGMDRTTQRNLALLIDQMAAEELEEAAAPARSSRSSGSGPQLILREGTSPPPRWVFYCIAGVLAAAVLLARRNSKRSWR